MQERCVLLKRTFAQPCCLLPNILVFSLTWQQSSQFPVHFPPLLSSLLLDNSPLSLLIIPQHSCFFSYFSRVISASLSFPNILVFSLTSQQSSQLPVHFPPLLSSLVQYFKTGFFASCPIPSTLVFSLILYNTRFSCPFSLCMLLLLHSFHHNILPISLMNVFFYFPTFLTTYFPLSSYSLLIHLFS